MSEFFRFEDPSRDFPYYRHNPKISKTAWIVLLLLVPISFILYAVVGLYSEFLGSLIFCFSLLIPLLYYSNWDYSLLFRKPTKQEIKLAVLLFIGYIIYAVVVGEILYLLGLSGTATSDSLGVTLESTVSLIFSMMGEELIKFIPLMFFLRLFYKYTNDRKLSVVLSTAIILIYFGLLHYDPYTTTIISVLLTQGLGSMFELYGYIKTKNLFVPYITHLLTDAIIFIIILLGL